MSTTRGVGAALLTVALSILSTSPVPAAPSELAPTAQKPKARTGIRLVVRPGDVKVFIDGVAKGVSGDLDFVPTKPGTRNLRLVRGGDEFEAEIPIAKGQVVEFTYDFE